MFVCVHIVCEHVPYVQAWFLAVVFVLTLIQFLISLNTTVAYIVTAVMSGRFCSTKSNDIIVEMANELDLWFTSL